MKPFIRNTDRIQSDNEQALAQLLEGLDGVNEIPTNTEKLSLQSIGQGHIVKITGEAGRLEIFVGTDPSDNDHWEIIGPNTFELFVYASADGDEFSLSFNGSSLSALDTTVSLGWFRSGEEISVTHDYAGTEAVDAWVSAEFIDWQINGVSVPANRTDDMQSSLGIVTIYNGYAVGEARPSWRQGTGSIRIFNAPPRGSVRIPIYGEAS